MYLGLPSGLKNKFNTCNPVAQKVFMFSPGYIPTVTLRLCSG